METAHYIDTHAHLPMLEHDSLDAILARARAAGVTHLVTVATEEGNWDSSRDIALREPHIYYTLGLHPHEAGRWGTVGPALAKRFDAGVPEKCVGIGETGLDFHYDFAKRDEQIACFEGHVSLAARVNRPLIIHCREAFDDLFQSIRKIGLGKAGGVMHCFTGNYEQAKRALDIGLKISFSGILTFKNADVIRDAAKQLPLDTMMVETDCPYLAPIPHRGKPNEPAYVALTGKFLAELRGIPEAEMAKQLSNNAANLFGFSGH
jgi:TatD DNase family protein